MALALDEVEDLPPKIGHTHSSLNLGAADYVFQMAKILIKDAGIPRDKITLLPLYRVQKELLDRDDLNTQKVLSETPILKVAVLDSFIGQDDEIVIFDLVRTEKFGFMMDQTLLIGAH